MDSDDTRVNQRLGMGARNARWDSAIRTMAWSSPGVQMASAVKVNISDAIA